MSRRSCLLVVFILLLCGNAAALLAEPRIRLDFRLPAPLVSWVGLGAVAAAPSALLLVGGDDGPRTLLRADVLDRASGAPRLTVLRSGLASDLTELEVMESAVGEPWVAVGAPGRVVALGPLERPAIFRVLAEAPGVALGAVDMRRAPRPLRERPVVRGGRLDAITLHGDDAERSWTASLPVRAESTGWGLRLTTPPVSWLPTAPPSLVAMEAVGRERDRRPRRRRATVVQDGETTEVRLDVSGMGQLLDRRLLVVDDVPHAALVAIPKLGLFVDRRLHLYRLAPGRPEGHGPTTTLATACPLWSEVEVASTDLDGDGADDLMVGCRRGFDGDELRLEAHAGTGDGRFGSRLGRRDLRVTADDWSFEHDVTGDGRLDLVVLSAERLLLWEGRSAGLFADEPAWSVALEAVETSRAVLVGVQTDEARASASHSGPRRLLVTDWNDDGVGEIVVLSEAEDGTTVMSVLR